MARRAQEILKRRELQLVNAVCRFVELADSS
jgi:hypothetical protein